MKKIGLIGGMSFESTITYYEQINRKINERLGGLSSAEILLSSVNFEEIEACQRENRWDDAGEILARHARILQGGGADFIFICTNTMHRCFDAVQGAVSVPVAHIADATLKALKNAGVAKVGLLGTVYTMTQDFYIQKLIDRGFEVVIPDDKDIDVVNNIIYGELCLGEIMYDSRKEYQRIIQGLKDKGAEAVILGCTEIGLLIHQDDSVLPIFDTTEIHAKRAAEIALTE